MPQTLQLVTAFPEGTQAAKAAAEAQCPKSSTRPLAYALPLIESFLTPFPPLTPFPRLPLPRLELGVAPHIDTWPQALAVMSRPANGPRALALLAELSDEVLAAAGDGSVDMDWYAKRALVGGVYAATELYMLTDFSPVRGAGWALGFWGVGFETVR